MHNEFDINLAQRTSVGLGTSYQLPAEFTTGSNRVKNLLTGSYNFTIDEIEVFYGDLNGK